jgi:hypothetical protein
MITYALAVRSPCFIHQWGHQSGSPTAQVGHNVLEPWHCVMLSLGGAGLQCVLLTLHWAVSEAASGFAHYCVCLAVTATHAQQQS